MQDYACVTMKDLGLKLKQKYQARILSPAQQGIFFESIRSSHPVYISQMCLRFSGAFNCQLFQEAYYHLIERHDILRTSFEVDTKKKRDHTLANYS